MTPPKRAHILGLLTAGMLLFWLLLTPRSSAGGGADNEVNGTSSGDGGSAAEMMGVDVEEGNTENATANGSATAMRHSVRASLNLALIIDRAGKETPILNNREWMVITGAGSSINSESVQTDRMQTAGHPLGVLKPIVGGVLNISWQVRIRLVSENGLPVSGATIWIVDGFGNVVTELRSDEDGLSPPTILIQAQISDDGIRDLNPYVIMVDGGNGVQEFPTIVESDMALTLVIEIPFAGEPLSALTCIAAAFAAIASCLVTPLTFDRSRYAVLIPIIPLYSKLRKEDIIGQSTRGRILDYIRENPGEHFGAIKRALSLSNGNAVYHLRFLEKEGLIKSRANGVYRRFYTKDFLLPPDNGDALFAGY